MLGEQSEYVARDRPYRPQLVELSPLLILEIFPTNIFYKYLILSPFSIILDASTTIILSSSSSSPPPLWLWASSLWLMAFLASKYLTPFMKINPHLLKDSSHLWSSSSLLMVAAMKEEEG